MQQNSKCFLMFENEVQWVDNCVMCPTAMRTKKATPKQKKFLIFSCEQEKGLERADSARASCALYTERLPCALRRTMSSRQCARSSTFIIHKCGQSRGRYVTDVDLNVFYRIRSVQMDESGPDLFAAQRDPCTGF